MSFKKMDGTFRLRACAFCLIVVSLRLCDLSIRVIVVPLRFRELSFRHFVVSLRLVVVSLRLCDLSLRFIVGSLRLYDISFWIVAVCNCDTIFYEFLIQLLQSEKQSTNKSHAIF